MPTETVKHELKVFEALPPRRTLLDEQINTIARHPEWYGKPVQIGSYAKVSAANGAKHLLQKRWGKKPEEQGWLFATRTLTEDGEKRTGLFAIFTPDLVGKPSPVAEAAQEKVAEAKPEQPKAEAPKPKAEAPKAAREEVVVEEPTAQEPTPEQPKARRELTPEQMERLARIDNLDELLSSLAD